MYKIHFRSTLGGPRDSLDRAQTLCVTRSEQCSEQRLNLSHFTHGPGTCVCMTTPMSSLSTISAFNGEVTRDETGRGDTHEPHKKPTCAPSPQLVQCDRAVCDDSLYVYFLQGLQHWLVHVQIVEMLYYSNRNTYYIEI
jgi:hypothetical protein